MSVNFEELDHIIQSAEHTKDLALNANMWERLDGKLEVDRHKKRSSKYKMMSMVSTAACVVLLLGFFLKSACISHNSSGFVIESLDEYQMSNGVYQYEDIDLLNKKRACQPC